MISTNDVFKAAKAYIEKVTSLPNKSVLQARKDVILPKSSYVLMSLLDVSRRGTNWHRYNQVDNLTVYESVTLSIQCDCFGEESFVNASAIQINFLDMAGTEFFKAYPGISPYGCSDIRSLPFINETDSYEPRNMVELTFDVKQFYTHDQDFFDYAELKHIYVVR